MPPAVIPLRWLLGSVTLSLGVVIALMARLAMPVEVGPWFGGIMLVVIGGAATTRFWLRDAQSTQQRIGRDAAEYFGLFVSICIIGALAAYPVSALSSGFVDELLQGIDDALGFQWLAWYRFVVDRPVVQRLGWAAYETIFVSPVVLLSYFAWAGRKAEARRFIASFGIAALLTLVLFALFPAKGPLAYLWSGPLPYVPASALYGADLIPALRSHMAPPIDLGTLRGLVAAPSFHAASAVLYVFAAWAIKPLRWPIAIMNAAMLIATPVEGTHYLADLIAGALVACAALGITRTIAAAISTRRPSHNVFVGGWRAARQGHRV